MKKLLAMLLAIMFITLTSCGKSNNIPTQTTDEHNTTITTSSAIIKQLRKMKMKI